MTPLLLLLALAPLSTRGDSDLYRRAVTRAVARAQTDLYAAAAPRFEVDHSRWDDPWIVTTEHYEVRSTESYAQARRYADELEFMRREFVALLGPGRNPTRRSQIWIFPSIGDYNTFNADAAEHSSMLGSNYAGQHPEQPVATYQERNATLLGMWITHGAVHQYLDQCFGPQRLLWVEEGLASYFALFWDWSYGASQLEEVEKSRAFVPLERLVRDPIEAYVGNAHARFVELGMLFRFLLDTWESTRNGAAGDPTTGPFQDYLRTVARGQSGEGTEFARIFDEAASLIEDDFKSFEFPQED